MTRAGRSSRTIVVGICLVLGVRAHAVAQTAQPRTYRPNAADEDWTFLKTAEHTDIWDPVKYIPLGRDNWSMTLSGEVRFRPEGFRIRSTATRPSTVDNYLLQRYLFGADVRFGGKARVFAEVQSGLIRGQLRSPRPTDRNAVDLHQAFVQLALPAGGGDRVALNVGRQEMEIGSSRLISASPGLNVKRSFDGLAGSYARSKWKLAGVVAQLVGLQGGAFDDPPDREQLFWGGALSRSGLLARTEAGTYYLGIKRSDSIYVQGHGPELRHTVGLKWSGRDTHFDLNYDAVLQWGRFSDAPLRAWAFATETGFRVGSRWKPRFSLRTDLASGDHDAAAARLESFNPLFPGNAYSGAVGLFGPTNLTDLTPGLTFAPVSSLTLGAELPSYWRTSTGDGVYSTDLRVLVGPNAGAGKYVGTNPGVLAIWRATAHLELQGAITRFVSGAFLERTFVSAGFGFYSFTARYRF